MTPPPLDPDEWDEDEWDEDDPGSWDDARLDGYWQLPRNDEQPDEEGFRPDRSVVNDLTWYFQKIGRRPKGLTKEQRRRWNRIHRNLAGRGRRLCLYYTSTLHDRRLAIYSSDAEIEEALWGTDLPSCPPAPMEWLREVDGYAAKGADSPEERRILTALREHAPEGVLRAELSEYLQNASRPYDPKKPADRQSHFENFIVLSFQAARRALCAGGFEEILVCNNGGSLKRAFVDAPSYHVQRRLERVDTLIRDALRGTSEYPAGELETSTWGDIRIGAHVAMVFAGRWYPAEYNTVKDGRDAHRLMEKY